MDIAGNTAEAQVGGILAALQMRKLNGTF